MRLGLSKMWPCTDAINDNTTVRGPWAPIKKKRKEKKYHRSFSTWVPIAERFRVLSPPPLSKNLPFKKEEMKIWSPVSCIIFVMLMILELSFDQINKKQPVVLHLRLQYVWNGNVILIELHGWKILDLPCVNCSYNINKLGTS